MTDFALTLAAALVGGLAAYRLKLPAVIGYLVAGVVVGPYSFRLVHDVGLIGTMASVGVVLLMFTLGMEFSVRDLRRVGPIGLWGGLAQIGLTSVLGFLVGRAVFQWPLSDAVLFGLLISLSSTMVVLKLLVERGETSTTHGRITVAILLVQDLAVLPLMVVLPALSHGGGVAAALAALGLALGKAIVFLGAITVVGLWAVPALLGHVAGYRSREMFLLTVLAISLGAAFSTTYFGVSQAFGAFAAGMLVSRSHFAHQALADIVPFRNAFAALFFVSLGMLASPRFILNNWPAVLSVALIIIAGKFVIGGMVARYYGYTAKTSLLVGAGLTQVGEFSFVVGQVGMATGVMSAYVYYVVLSSAILTILFTPAAFKFADWGYKRLSASPRFGPRLQFGNDGPPVDARETLADHVIISGHGRTGSNLANILRKYNIPYVVIELNPHIVSDLRSRGVPVIYGDAGNAQILSLAHVEKARVLALTCPDPMAEVEAVAYAKLVNPGIDIIVRVPDAAMSERLQVTGASETVEPALEASLEFVRHILRYYGVSAPEVEGIVCPFLRQQKDESETGSTVPST